MSSFVDIVRPQGKSQAFTFDCLAVLGGSLFIALLAQIAIPTPVPFTLQTLAVLLMGALLGRKKAPLAVLAYLAEGSLGLPFFAGGASGFSRLSGLTGGYLIGFVVAAYLVGFLLERGFKENYLSTIIALSLGSLCILGLGALWLSFFVGGFKMALQLGVLPFLIGDVLKILVAAALIPSGWKLIRALKC